MTFMALPLEYNVTNYTSFPILFGAENEIFKFVFSHGAKVPFVNTGTVHPHDASTSSIWSVVFPEFVIVISFEVKLPCFTLPR